MSNFNFNNIVIIFVKFQIYACIPEVNSRRVLALAIVFLLIVHLSAFSHNIYLVHT